MEKTIFEEILAGNIPAKKVYEDDIVLAFYDINPQAPIHVIVIPKIAMRNIAESTKHNPTDVGQFFQGVAKTAETLGLDKNGYRVVLNNGKDALQTVEYLHAHILAGKKLGWTPG